MFQITDAAAQTLKATLLEVREVDEPRFRLGIIDGSVKLAIDRERPGDTTVEHEGETLIVTDKPTLDRLNGRELDYEEDASRLVLK